MSVSIAAAPSVPSDAPAAAIAAFVPEAQTPRPSPWPDPVISVDPSPDSSPIASPLALATLPPTRTDRPVPTSFDKALKRKLKRIVSNTVKNRRVAGLSVAVRLPGGATWIGVAGHAEFRPPRKVRSDTVFAIASITKTFIAALILQLAEEGKLSLDEPFGAYNVDAPRGKKVTIRQLLSHRSGIHNYFESPKYARQVFSDRGRRWDYEDILGLVKSRYCKPGRCYHYSNTNYVILGRIAEEAGGASLHKLLRDRFFEPLGLDDTVYQPHQRPPRDAAHGHWRSADSYIDHTRESRVIPFMAAASVAGAAGAIASTAEDLATWADALYGGDVLSPDSLRQMTRFRPPDGYGLGTRRRVFHGHRALGHGGSLRGFEGTMWYFPEEDVTIVLLSNQGLWLIDPPIRLLVKAVLGRSGTKAKGTRAAR